MHSPNICLDKMLKTTVTDKITDIMIEDRMWDLQSQKWERKTQTTIVS